MPSWKDKARERVKAAKQGATFKLVEGSNCFRVLPNKKGVNHAPYLEFRIHRNVGPDNTWVRCGKDIDGSGKCWMCDLKLPEMRKSANSAKRAKAEEMAPRDQFLVQVSSYDTELGKFAPPKPWWVPTGGSRSLGVALLSLLANSRRSYDDPIKGYNISIERTGTGFKDTRYGAMEPDEEPTKVPGSILAAMKELEELVAEYSAESQKAAFYGEKPTETPTRSSKRQEAEAEEEEEAEAEEEEEEEAEAEEEEEEEAEAEEEEEEEAEKKEKPSKTKKPDKTTKPVKAAKAAKTKPAKKAKR